MTGIVIIGAGPAGREAARLLPDAAVIARPAATAWHAEPGTLWIETGAGVSTVPFATLLLCADEPLLLAALGCAFDSGRPVVDGRGATTVPGVFAAGRIVGARTPEDAAAKAAIAACALREEPAGPAITADTCPLPDTERLDPLGLAGLLEQSPGESRDAAALAQCALLGPVLPARSVSLAALAGYATEPPLAGPLQSDTGTL